MTYRQAVYRLPSTSYHCRQLLAAGFGPPPGQVSSTGSAVNPHPRCCGHWSRSLSIALVNENLLWQLRQSEQVLSFGLFGVDHESVNGHE